MAESEKNLHDTGLQAFQPLRIGQTDSKIELSGQLKAILTDYIRQDILKSVKQNQVYSKQYTDSRIEYIATQIQEHTGEKYEKVSFFSQEDGMYRFFDANSNEIYRANLVQLWNESILPTEEKNRLHAQMKEESDRLKELLNRESVLGGSIVMEFAPTVVVGGLLAESAVSASQKILNLKAIYIKNASGVMERVGLGDQVVTGTREWMRANALKISESLMLHFDPRTKLCTNIGANAMRETMSILHKATFSELREKYGINITETQYKEFKQQLPALTAFLQQSGNNLAQTIKFATEKGLHVVMFPIFFLSFQKQPNSATLVAGLAEMIAFNQGAKLGGATIGKFGIFGKVVGPIAGGIAGVIGTHYLYDEFDGDIKKWKLFNGKDMFSHKSSAIMHLATGWGVNEFFDDGNDVGLDKNPELKYENEDISIPSYDWGRDFPDAIAKGKYSPIGFLSGGTGVTPVIDLYKRIPSFDINPWEWFNASINGRTVEKWNMLVDVYKRNLLQNITILLGEFQNNRYPFDGNQTLDEKKKILETRLHMMIVSMGSSMFQPQANSVILMIMAEVSNWNKDQSIDYIKDGVNQYIGYMYIDDTFIKLNKIKLEAQEVGIHSDLDLLARQLSDPAHISYILGLYDRVKSGKDIFEPDQLKYNASLDTTEFVPSPEHIIFNALLDSKNILKKESVDENGEMISKDLETRILFVSILERLSLYMQLTGFQERITKIDKNENGGEFVEIEYAKALGNRILTKTKNFFNK